MSDDWKVYPCQAGPDRAWVMFDNGIAQTLDKEAPPRLLRIRITFQNPQEDGMPGDLEFQRLNAVDDEVVTLAQSHDACYAGRITVAGHRHYYLYTNEDEAAWQTRLDALGKRHSYEVASYIEQDERHQGYWKDLYPDEDSWQVIKDMQVLEVLRKEGDDGTMPRRVEHWSYFPTAIAAENFAKWLREIGYEVMPISEGEDGEFKINFSHDGTLGLVEITSKTIQLGRKAKEFGGTYDGWETPVCKPLSVGSFPGKPPGNKLTPRASKPWWKFW